jgi:type II secretory pathway component PulK
MEKLAIHTLLDSLKMVRKETTTEPKWWEQRRITTLAQKRYEAELRDEEDQCNYNALCVHNRRTFYNEAKYNEHWE